MKKLLLLSILALMFFTGCEKENFEPIPKPHINKIMVPIEWYKKASDTVTIS